MEEIQKDNPEDISKEIQRTPEQEKVVTPEIAQKEESISHGKQMEVKPELFKQQDFIGDEGFRNTGVALQDHPQNRSAGWVHDFWHLNSRRRCCMVSMPVSLNREMAS